MKRLMRSLSDTSHAPGVVDVRYRDHAAHVVRVLHRDHAAVKVLLQVVGRHGGARQAQHLGPGLWSQVVVEVL